MQALIHEMSSSVALPRFDLFGVPPTQNMIDRDIVTEHRPITLLDPSSFVQFEIQSAFDEYIDLEKLFFYLKVKVKPIDNIKAIEHWDDIAPANYILHSMIRQLDVFIGEKQISTTTPTYAYKAYIEALFGFPISAKESHLSSAGWFEDTHRKMDGPDTLYNDSIKGYKILDLYGRLHTDLTFQGRNLLGGCKLTIRILFNDPKFYFNTFKSKPEFEFLEASLHIHRAKVPQAIVDAHDAALRISNAKYPITLAKVKPITINKGLQDANIDNIHSGQIPKRIFIFFVDNAAYVGDYRKNPYYFKHFDLSSLCVYIDGTQYPPKPFTPFFDEKGFFIKEMISLYEALDMMDGDSVTKINRKNYKDGNVIFGFNFAPDLTSGVGSTGHLNPIKFGSLRLNVKFLKPLEQTITALVYCEFDKILEIDINRNAHIDLF